MLTIGISKSSGTIYIYDNNGTLQTTGLGNNEQNTFGHQRYIHGVKKLA